MTVSYIYYLMLYCNISSALALEILLSCIKSSKYFQCTNWGVYQTCLRLESFWHFVECAKNNLSKHILLMNNPINTTLPRVTLTDLLYGVTKISVMLLLSLTKHTYTFELTIISLYWENFLTITIYSRVQNRDPMYSETFFISFVRPFIQVRDNTVYVWDTFLWMNGCNITFWANMYMI